MTNYFWNGSASTSASTAANWTPSGTPAAGDVVIFDAGATQGCVWDIALPASAFSVDEVILESTFSYTLTLNTNMRIKGLFLNKTIAAGGASKILFEHGASPNFFGSYKTYNERFVLIGDSGDATGITFEMVGSSSPVTKFDDGAHPIVTLSIGRFAPDYVAPTGTSGKATFDSFTVTSPTDFSPDGDLVDNDRLKVFSFKVFSITSTSIDFGLATAEYYATSGGFYIPTAGATGYPSGFTAYYRKIVLKTNTAGQKCLMDDNTYISVEEFEIDDGVVLKGPVDDTSQGADIRSIKTPKLRGTWSFSQISPGIYRSPRHASGPMPKVNGDFHITGKLTVDGLIDPTGMVFTPQATNPETTNPENTIWIDSETGHLIRGDRDTESTVHFNVRNDEGATIPLGAPLYSKGEIGGSNRIKVGIADASDPAKMPAIGLAMEEMNTTSTKDGNMIITGILNENITITGVAERDIVYVAPHGGTAPYLTITRPTSGSHLVQNVGVCVKQASANVSQGMKVSAIGRTNDIPNGVITTNSADADYVYIDDGNTFKKITPSDLGIGGGGGSGTVTSVALTGSDGIEVDSGSPITTSGTIALGVDKTSMLSHLNIEDGADVTDTTNVTAAGALMDSEVTNLADVKAFDPADYATAAQGATADAALPKTGGTMTGEIEATTITLNAIPADPQTDNKVRLGESGTTTNMLQIQTNDGYVLIGANNGSYAHLYTDRSQFYINRPITLDSGILYAYNDGLQLGTGTNASSGTTAITIADGSTDITVAGTATSTGFIKTGGLATEYLMADGSVTTGGGGTPSGVAGAIQFSDGAAFASDDANLHYDDANNRLGVGTNTPSETLHVSGTIRQTNATSAVLVADANGDISAASNLSDQAYLASGQAEIDPFNPITSGASWLAPPPATIQEAIDRLAAYVVTIPGAPPQIP